MYKVYVTDYDYPDLNIEKNIYKDYPVEFIPLKCNSEEKLIDEAKDADVLHNQYLKLTKKTFSCLKNLKVVSRYGVGLNNINLDDAKKYNISIINVPDYCTQEVSNNALSMILCFARKIKRSDMMVREGIWDFARLRPIHDYSQYRVGIIGLGRIGRVLGKKLTLLGFSTLYVNDIDETVIDRIDYAYKVRMGTLEKLLKNSDFISLNVPLTDKTYHLINRNTLKYVKDNVSIINTSRGLIINEDDLYEFLKDHPNANAGLDVLESEPPNIKANKLFKLNNIIFTPHISFYSEESLVRMRKSVTLNVIDCLFKNK